MKQVKTPRGVSCKVIRNAVAKDIQQFFTDQLTPNRGYKIPIHNVHALIRSISKPVSKVLILNVPKFASLLLHEDIPLPVLRKAQEIRAGINADDYAGYSSAEQRRYRELEQLCSDWLISSCHV